MFIFELEITTEMRLWKEVEHVIQVSILMLVLTLTDIQQQMSKNKRLHLSAYEAAVDILVGLAFFYRVGVAYDGMEVVRKRMSG